MTESTSGDFNWDDYEGIKTTKEEKRVSVADFILAENLKPHEKENVAYSIFQFVDCDDATTLLRLNSRFDEDHKKERAFLESRLVTMDRLEQIRNLFENNLISTEAPWYDKLVKKMPLIIEFIEKANATLDYQDLRRLRQERIDKGKQTVANDLLLDEQE
jgi:hypothetical protein